MNKRNFTSWRDVQLRECLIVPHKEKEPNPETIERLTVKLHVKGIIRSGKYPRPTPNGRPYFKRLSGELLIGRQNLHNGGLGLVTKETSGSNAISSFVAKPTSDLNYIYINCHKRKHFKNKLMALHPEPAKKKQVRSRFSPRGFLFLSSVSKENRDHSHFSRFFIGKYA